MSTGPGTSGAVTTGPVMAAREVTKTYGGTHALRGVNFGVAPGRVTALFGENGAGKSTLMKILAGIESPTTGQVELDGDVVEFESPRQAADNGVVIIHQELSLCPNLCIQDNLFLAREERGRFGSRRPRRPARRHRDRPRTARGDARPATPRSATCGSASSRSSRSPARCCRTPAC